MNTSVYRTTFKTAALLSMILQGCGQAHFTGNPDRASSSSEATKSTEGTSDVPSDPSKPGEAPTETTAAAGGSGEAVAPAGSVPAVTDDEAILADPGDGNLNLCGGIYVDSGLNSIAVPANALYRTLEVPAGDTTDFANPSLDDSKYVVQRAGFYGPGDIPGDEQNCGIWMGGSTGCSDNTLWKASGSIILRRPMVLPKGAKDVLFCLNYPQRVEVYINGEQIIDSGDSGGVIGYAVPVPVVAKPYPAVNLLAIKVTSPTAKGRFNFTLKSADGSGDGSMTVGGIVVDSNH